MKLIESKAEYIPQEEGFEGIYKMIELAGRTAYHSQDKITPDSAKGFVDRMIKSKHGAALEAGTVYLKVPVETWRENEHEWAYMFPEELPWVSSDCDGKYWYITTNFRHVLEGNVGIETMNKYLCSPTEFHEKRYTMRFTCDKGVSHELVRHRVFSFAQESTRYCNYSKKDKFGNELTFILPTWLIGKLNLGHYEIVTPDNKDGEIIGDGYKKNVYDYSAENIFVKECLRSELQYINLINLQYSPQQARQILPNALKTEVCMTGFASDWRFFFDLRYYGKTGKPHPDMELLASKARSEFIAHGVWDDIMKYPSKFD